MGIWKKVPEELKQDLDSYNTIIVIMKCRNWENLAKIIWEEIQNHVLEILELELKNP